MKVLNIIWGFSLGAGVDKCFLTYASLDDVDDSLDVISVCLNIGNKSNISELKQIGAIVINVRNSFDFSWVSKLAALINEQKPEVIFTHGFNGAILMLLVRWFKRIKTPVVCSEHGLYFARTFVKKPLEIVYNTLMWYSYKKMVKRLICVDQGSRKYWIKRGVDASKIVTVHNGISKDFSHDKIEISGLKVNKDSKILITVSTLYFIKGLNYLLDAVASVRHRCETSFEYIVVGTGEDLQLLKNKAQRLKIDDIVHFVGYQENVPSWLDTSDIFIIPSLSECHSISLLEAMRAGKAIIATNVGGNPESIRNGIDGILVPPANPEALADAIEKLLNSEQLRNRYSKSASEAFRECFTEETMKRNLIKALSLN